MTESRGDMMCRMYGEVCTFTNAGRILSRHPNTIHNMCADGRLRTACGGTMVDVRSIAVYIESPKQIDELARVTRIRARNNKPCKWSV